jgi:xanthine dehydrogenase accessory factor
MNLILPNRESQKDTLTIARRWLDEFGQVALATVVSTWGSSPVPVGGQLVVGPNGQFEGSVSGGCVEVEVIAEAADVLTEDRPKLLEFGVAEDVAWRAGLPCGGAISIYLAPLRLKRDASYLDRILAARGDRVSLAVLTTFATGERRLFEAPGPMPNEIASCLHLGESRLLDLADGQAFLHALTPPVRLVIVGATHIGQVLAALATRIGCLYIGALGSKKTHAARLQRLRDAGFSDTELARIHAPVGLAIGAKGPAEIAVSILAEIVKVAHGAV